jgi:glycosyltransferase involved in cell wall biosynthesis
LKVAAVIPAKNESQTIAHTVIETRRFVDTVIVVTDAGTSDNTRSIAKHAGASVLESSEVGKGAALKAGFAAALDYGVEVVVTLDADNQCSPTFIPRLLQNLPQSQVFMVNGSRLLSSRSLFVFPRLRLYGNRLVANIVSRTLGIKVSDALTGMRVYSSSLIERVDINHNDFGVDAELLIQAWLNNANISEKSITSRFYNEHKAVPRPMLTEVLSSLVDCLPNLGASKQDLNPLATMLDASWDGTNIILPDSSLGQHSPYQIASYNESNDSYELCEPKIP